MNVIQEHREKILEILERCHLMSLATYDDSGLWVSDLIFIFDDNLNIYWMSNPGARHSKAILQYKEVAGTITFSTKSKEPNKGIQFAGVATKIDGQRHDLAVKHFRKRNRPEPSQDEDILKGNSWYMITPTMIDLIDEESFGFTKRNFV